MEKATQTLKLPIVQELERRLDICIEHWATWRDAQPDDEHRFLVDEIFKSQVRSIELLLASFGQDVIPF